MSYALTADGIVYAWGDNTDGSLALGHDKAVVDKPEPMMRMQGTSVKKLVVRDCGGSSKGKTVIAFVELAEPLPAKDTIGGYDRPLGEQEKPVNMSDDMASGQKSARTRCEGAGCRRFETFCKG